MEGREGGGGGVYLGRGVLAVLKGKMLICASKISPGLVTGNANFQMERTALTVGGFTQPGVARSIIEQHTGAERGFSQRFLWIFPKPTFAKFASLKPVPEEVTESM